MSESDFSPEEYRYSAEPERLPSDPTEASNQYLDMILAEPASEWYASMLQKTKRNR